jgi:hypothetical protein
VLELESGHRVEFRLPDQKDRFEENRRIRDDAVAWGGEHELTTGQLNAIKKELTEAGYYLRHQNVKIRRASKILEGMSEAERMEFLEKL